MGLFTKLFSRDSEAPKEAADQSAQPASGESSGSARNPEDVVANSPDANDPRARPAQSSAEPARAAKPASPETATTQPTVVVQQSVALGKTTGQTPPRGAATVAKRDAPAPKAPAALGATPASAAANANAAATATVN